MGIGDAKRRAAELVEMALESLEGFDTTADPLREIARYIIARKS
jgi:geranylgeranyl pyrophosphate synthase